MLQPEAPRLLVVEDEFLIRLTLVEALLEEAFEVLEAETADQALALLQGDPAIALLVTDIQLPGSMDGSQLAREARRSRPDLPVLFMTGRPDPQAAAGASPLDRFIAKPYTLGEIVGEVRALVGAAARG